MKENISLIELLSEINEGIYDEVKLIDKGNNIYIVTGVTSNASRFNFSCTCMNPHNNQFKTLSIIKDGKHSDKVDSIICKVEGYGILTYDIASTPLLPADVSIRVEDVTEAMLEEYRVDEQFNAYKSLRREYQQVVDKDTEKPATQDNPEEEVSQETTIVPCVTYQIQNKLDSTVMIDSLRESCSNWEEADSQYRKLKDIRKSVRFNVRSLIYQLESRRVSDSEYGWSEIKPLPRSKKKSFQELEVTLPSQSLTIRRIFWNEEIKI